MFDRLIRKGSFFGEQYLYVLADLASLQEPVFDQSVAINFPFNFLDSLNKSEQNIAEQKKMPVCVWGGASKGVIFSLLRKRAGLPVDLVVDINPAKQGGFLPATGFPVLSPEQALAELPIDSVIYVMNSNYLAEIKEMSQNKFNYIGID